MEYEFEGYEVRNIRPGVEGFIVRAMMWFSRNGQDQHPAIEFEVLVKRDSTATIADIENATFEECKLILGAANTTAATHTLKNLATVTAAVKKNT